MDMEVGDDDEVEVKERGDATQTTLGDLELLTHDTELIGTTLADARNGLNKLSRLSMLCTVQNHWPVGARFAFNCYRHWEQLLLCQPGKSPVTILSREGVTQGDPFSMVLIGITLTPLAEGLRAADLGLLSPSYADDGVFEGSV